jgi:amidase
MKPFDVDRRTLLARLGTVAGSLALAPATAAAPRREAAAKAATPAPRPHLDLEEATVDDLQRRMASGELSAEKLTLRYLERIEALDRPTSSGATQGPALRSVIETNPDALASARDLDRQRTRDGARGPLHGIPVLIKDNIDTGDRMATSAGSLALEANRAQRDAAVAERLRAAGAVILGKTNLSEWANFRSSKSSSGWSGRGGQTRNPYVLDRNPCGSSAGSGAAAAASLATITVGTETDGSIVCPSTLCGLVGVKPTVGLVSRAGIVPIASSQDTAGPMTRTVRDAAHLLTALAGEDPRDPATVNGRGKAADYARALEGASLRGARLGIARQFTGNHPAVDGLFEESLQALKAAGAELVDPVELPRDSEYGDAEYQVLLYEFKQTLNAYLATTPATVTTRSLAELIAWNEANKDREMPWFGQEIFLQAQEKGPLGESAYIEARARCLRLAKEQGIEATMRKHRLDAIVAPTGGPAWVTDWVNGDHYTGGCSTPAAVAGSPHVTVPAGFVHGLPVGLSFFGLDWSEARLLRLAFAFERETRARRAPEYRATIG